MALRPPFETTTALELEEVKGQLREALAAEGGGFRGTVRGTLLEVARRGDVRFWTPQLRARLAEEDGRTMLRGRFAPAPEMWTLYIVIYLHLAFAGLAAILFGTAQAIMGSAPWGFWITGAACIVGACVHRFAAYVGQRFGSSDMDAITAFVEESVGGVSGDLQSPGPPALGASPLIRQDVE